MPLLWRVFASNAVVLACATLVLAVSPATVSFPIALVELLVLLGGLGAMLAVDLLLLRRAFAPLARLTVVMRGVDPLRPGARGRIRTRDPLVAELGAAFDDMLSRLEVERRESARRALAAQEAERARIARELHDEVGQALTAVVLQLERASRDPGDRVRADVHEAKELVRATLEDVRGIARRLRPEALDDLGLASALAALATSVGRRTHVQVRRRLGGTRSLTRDEELVVYRVAQEALTNVVRHAGARTARITLEDKAGAPVLTIRDEGRGFDPEAIGDGAGLRGMRERAVLIAADLEVTSGPGRGTTIRLRLP